MSWSVMGVEETGLGKSILIFVAFLNTGDKKNRQPEVRCCSPRNLVDRARLPVTDTWRCDLN